MGWVTGPLYDPLQFMCGWLELQFCRIGLHQRYIEQGHYQAKSNRGDGHPNWLCWNAVMSILGLWNYYKWFIKNYCIITAPLQELLKKSVHFRWTDEQEEAFNSLKDVLFKAPVLAFPNPDEPYIMDTDASNLAIGAVLSQEQDGEDRVIMYGSKTFSGSQRHSCMTRRELFTIIHFVMMKFSYYLLNQEFTLQTDHSSLRWLDLFHDKATDVLAWWLHYLELFRPYKTILYRPGKMHGNADALSRIDTKPCPHEDCPDHSHLIMKVKTPSEEKPRLLCASKQGIRMARMMEITFVIWFLR